MTVHIPLSPYVKWHKCFMRVTGRTPMGNEMWITFECDDPHCDKGCAAAPWVFTGGQFK